jgi:hypothetical protein
MPREDLPFCDCRWLERAAHDPDNPIEFDPELNEYNLKTPRGHSLRIYYCPFALDEHRNYFVPKCSQSFPPEESMRLHNLIKDLKTQGDVIAALGEPTHVIDPGGTRTEPGKHGKPVRFTRSRRCDMKPFQIRLSLMRISTDVEMLRFRCLRNTLENHQRPHQSLEPTRESFRRGSAPSP